MQFIGFIVRTSSIIGVRFCKENKLMDAYFSQISELNQLDLLNLDYLRGIRCFDDQILTLDEIQSHKKIPLLNDALDFSKVHAMFLKPKTHTKINLDFFREAEMDMYDWLYNKPDKVLYVKGARQTGKTYAIHKFIHSAFGEAGVYCINLADEDTKKVLREFQERTLDKNFYTKGDTYIERFAKYLYSDFDIHSARVLYIDEIQEDSGLYNSIREFARKKECRLIVSGSYLNIVSNARLGNNIYKPPAGGSYVIHMRSLNFMEFLQANGIINSQLLFKTSDNYTEEEHLLFERVQKLYHVYLKIGGYPEVVKSYIRTGSIEEAQNTLSDLMEDYFEESAPYLNLCNQMIDLRETFQILLTVLTDYNKRFKCEDILSSIDKEFRAKGARVSSSEIFTALLWLRDSGFIGYSHRYHDLGLQNFTEKQRCYFYDLGIVNYIASRYYIPESEIHGFLAENFVYLQISDSFREPVIGYIDIQNHKDLGNIEFDFIYRDTNKNGFVGIEVKYGNSVSKSLNTVRKNNKILLDIIKSVDRKTDFSTGTIPVFLVRFYCLINTKITA